MRTRACGIVWATISVYPTHDSECDHGGHNVTSLRLRIHGLSFSPNRGISSCFARQIQASLVSYNLPSLHHYLRRRTSDLEDDVSIYICS